MTEKTQGPRCAPGCMVDEGRYYDHTWDCLLEYLCDVCRQAYLGFEGQYECTECDSVIQTGLTQDALGFDIAAFYEDPETRARHLGVPTFYPRPVRRQPPLVGSSMGAV